MSDEIKLWQTLLRVPGPLRERIVAQGKIDLREYKAEILVLLDEAVTAREKKAAR